MVWLQDIGSNKYKPYDNNNLKHMLDIGLINSGVHMFNVAYRLKGNC